MERPKAQKDFTGIRKGRMHMSDFGENLQFYRKQKEMTQEQLAEQLDVSRQTVSKWESGASYPEMEKILQLCDLFSCNMDILMRKNAAESEQQDGEGYERYMEKRRKNITIGVTLLILGVAFWNLLFGLGWREPIVNTLFFATAIVAILVLVVAGIQDETYRKNHPLIPEFYTKEEIARFDEKFPIRIAAGIGAILVGVLIAMNAEDFPREFGMGMGVEEEFYYGIFLLLVAIGVGIFVHTGLGKAKYDIAAYNRENDRAVQKENEKVGIWCGCIMIVATIVFFVAGFVYDLWEVCWVVFPVGGMICGIVALILKGKQK